jgi:hypothetical protein
METGKILQVAIPIFKAMTALDFVGPYEVLNCLPNVKVVFVSHSVGLYTDLGTLTVQATASFDQVGTHILIYLFFFAKSLCSEWRRRNGNWNEFCGHENLSDSRGWM